MTNEFAEAPAFTWQRKIYCHMQKFVGVNDSPHTKKANIQRLAVVSNSLYSQPRWRLPHILASMYDSKVISGTQTNFQHSILLSSIHKQIFLSQKIYSHGPGEAKRCSVEIESANSGLVNYHGDINFVDDPKVSTESTHCTKTKWLILGEHFI